MLDERGRHVAEQGRAVRARALQLPATRFMTHDFFLRLSEGPCEVPQARSIAGRPIPVFCPLPFRGEDMEALATCCLAGVGEGGPLSRVPLSKIGRASCRERVCQYV